MVDSTELGGVRGVRSRMVPEREFCEFNFPEIGTLLKLNDITRNDRPARHLRTDPGRIVREI